MEFDITWQNPSEAQAAALDLAMRITNGRGLRLSKWMVPYANRPLTEFEVAEFICLADKSLWYTQAKGWIEKPPVEEAGTKQVWQRACKFIVDVVDSGYNVEKQVWWDMSRYGKAGIMVEYLMLADFMFMLEQIRQKTLIVVSSGFDVFALIQLGPNWQPRFRKLIKSIAEKAKMKERGKGVK